MSHIRKISKQPIPATVVMWPPLAKIMELQDEIWSFMESIVGKEVARP